ncbi:MAG: XTP/dITP diphosphatase [Promethearchaeota archaeon]
MKKTITFVTGNPNKFQEVAHLIQEKFPNYEVVQSDKELLEIQAESLEEVAKFKLQSVKKWIKVPYFIEDAGFFVDDVCHGFPGVYSHYVMDTLGYKGILKIMDKSKARKAHFESVIAYMDEYYQMRFFTGINNGQVSMEARGTSGFGFDPIFLSEDSPDRTFAELNIAEKNEISHRRRAMMKFMEFLELKEENKMS